MTRSFGEYSLPLAVVLFPMYLHDCVSCMMFKRYFVPIQPLGFNSDDAIHWINGTEIELVAIHQV